MSNLSAQLAAESAFADEVYRKHGTKLAINPTMFAKYATPNDPADWRQYAASKLGSVAGRRLLDLGCGCGEEASYLAKLGAQVFACDISSEGVRLTRERAAHNGLQIEVAQVTLDEIPWKEGSFDIVHGMGILHHVGLASGLSTVRRYLKPGGLGVFLDPLWSLVERPKMLFKRSEYTEFEAPLRWDELRAATTDFRVFEIKPFHLVRRLHGLPGMRQLRYSRSVEQFDHRLLSYFPVLRHFAGGVVTYLETK